MPRLNQWVDGNRARLLCSLLVLLVLKTTHVWAVRPCFGPHAKQADLQLVTDCRWGAAQVAAVTVSGALDPVRSGPPAIVAASEGVSACPGAVSAVLSHVVLSGFKLPSPSTSQHRLIPAGLLCLPSPATNSSIHLSLQDVRLLVDGVSLRQHVDFFKQQPKVTLYTDGATFAHVNFFATEAVTWRSVGLLLSNGLEDARSTATLNSSSSRRDQPAGGKLDPVAGAPAANNSSSSSSNSSSSSSSRRGRALREVHAPAPAAYNYVLAANDTTLTAQLQRLGAIEGPTPCLIYLDGNVTLTKPPVPAAGIPVKRPMAIVGLSGHNTSMDWHMEVNQLLLNYKWSNITFDSVVVENLGPGDARSAELAQPLSVTSGNNFWPLYYNRSEDRLLLKNVTFTMASQAELDYYMYWATVFHSNLPYFKSQAEFAQNVIKIRVWKVGWQTDTTIQVIQCYSASCRVEDCLFTLHSVVAPQMPVPQALGPDLKLRAAEKSPLVTAVGSPQALMDQLSPLTGSEASRLHVILLRTNISLQPLLSHAAASSGTGANSSSAHAAPAPANPAARVPAGVPPSGVPVVGPLSIVGDLSEDANTDYATTALDLGFSSRLLEVTPPNGGKGGGVQVQHLVLRGLTQGPRAAAATDLQSPDVWTLLGWAFQRSGDNDVVLSGCVLELPPPEFEHLTALARSGGGQVVLKLAGDVRGAGDGLVVLNGITRYKPQRMPSRNSSSGSRLRRQLLASSDGVHSMGLWMESMSAQGLTGSKVVLMPAADAARVPGGHYWPADSSSTGGSGRLSSGALAAAIAVPVVCVAAAAAAVAFLLLARRRRRRWQQQQLSGDKAESVTAPGAPPSSRSSSYGSAKATPEPKAGPAVAPIGRCNEPLSHGQRDQGGTAQSAASADDVALVLPSSRNSLDVAAYRDAGLRQLGIQGATTHARLGTAAAAAAALGLAVSPCSSRATPATGDSARSLSLIPSPCLSPLAQQGGLEPQQQQEQPQPQPQHRQRVLELSPLQPQQQQPSPSGAAGLSHRLSSAISHLQQDITRRRIGAVQGAGPQQQGASSSGGRTNSSPALPAGTGTASTSSSSKDRAEDSTARRGGTPANSSSAGSGDQQLQLKPAADSERMRRSTAVTSPPAGEGGAVIVGAAAPAELQTLALIGRGSFASVFRAIWRGRCVALKVVQLPGGAGDEAGDELAAALQTRERMAVMEAVISVTMSHPNIVQVYTFALQPLYADVAAHTDQQSPVSPGAVVTQQQQQQQQQHHEAGVTGWELRLIMEYCEEGSLRAALNQQRLVDPESPTRLPAVHLVLALAHDVACAMLHLHEEHIVHSDLKASNILLTKANTNAPFSALVAGPGGDARAPHHSSLGRPGQPGSCAALLAAAQTAAGGRLVAKVADFGLSLALDPTSTHISHMHAGTLTHMAPELLLHGRASKASDVYAYGILLWEMVTGLRAFQGMPVALVGHNVTILGLRPPWVPGVSPALRQLVEQCWAQDPNDRPTFATVLMRVDELLQLTPEQLAPPASPFASTHQQQHQQQLQQQGACNGAVVAIGGLGAGGAAAAAGGAPLVGTPDAAHAAAGVPAAALDAGVTGDWTM